MHVFIGKLWTDTAHSHHDHSLIKTSTYSSSFSNIREVILIAYFASRFITSMDVTPESSWISSTASPLSKRGLWERSNCIQRTI